MVLAYFIECACPPDRRSATVAAGALQSVEEFLKNYQLTHIVCQTCDSYYQLIGYIDQNGVERRVETYLEARMPPTRRGRRMATSDRAGF